MQLIADAMHDPLPVQRDRRLLGQDTGGAIKLLHFVGGALQLHCWLTLRLGVKALQLGAVLLAIAGAVQLGVNVLHLALQLLVLRHQVVKAMYLALQLLVLRHQVELSLLQVAHCQPEAMYLSLEAPVLNPQLAPILLQIDQLLGGTHHWRGKGKRSTGTS